MPNKMRRLIAPAVAISAFAAATTLTGYGRAIREIRRNVRGGGQIAGTALGPIEYGIDGSGLPVLLIHGAGGGYDQGLLLGRAFAPPGVQIIAPSRFGYLRTPLRVDSSPSAQAHAHAALLDSLGLESAIVVGVSAGAPSAVEMVLHYPKRVRGLILAVPRGYAPDSAELPVSRSTLMTLQLILSSDFACWTALQLAGRRMIQYMGVPAEVLSRASDAERERVLAMMRNILPIGPRLPGLRNDLETKLAPLPADRINLPTLVITTRDDLFKTLPAAEFIADRIAGARLIVLRDGGHLFVNRRREVAEAIARFLASGPAMAGRPASLSRGQARLMSGETSA